MSGMKQPFGRDSRDIIGEKTMMTHRNHRKAIGFESGSRPKGKSRAKVKGVEAAFKFIGKEVGSTNDLIRVFEWFLEVFAWFCLLSVGSGGLFAFIYTTLHPNCHVFSWPGCPKKAGDT